MTLVCLAVAVAIHLQQRHTTLLFTHQGVALSSTQIDFLLANGVSMDGQSVVTDGEGRIKVRRPSSTTVVALYVYKDGVWIGSSDVAIRSRSQQTIELPFLHFDTVAAREKSPVTPED